MRYEIRNGKFGTYFLDTEEDQDMSLALVLELLNQGDEASEVLRSASLLIPGYAVATDGTGLFGHIKRLAVEADSGREFKAKHQEFVEFGFPALRARLARALDLPEAASFLRAVEFVEAAVAEGGGPMAAVSRMRGETLEEIDDMLKDYGFFGKGRLESIRILVDRVKALTSVVEGVKKVLGGDDCE